MDVKYCSFGVNCTCVITTVKFPENGIMEDCNHLLGTKGFVIFKQDIVVFILDIGITVPCTSILTFSDSCRFVHVGVYGDHRVEIPQCSAPLNAWVLEVAGGLMNMWWAATFLLWLRPQQPSLRPSPPKKNSGTICFLFLNFWTPYFRVL